jgi:hypothetical protein
MEIPSMEVMQWMHQKQASSQKLSLGELYSKATPLEEKQNFA